LERRYRTKFGELDIVTRHGAFTVFVEVKAKHDGSFGDPYEAVTPQKQQRVVMMATDYVSRHRLHETPLRFDVVSIETGVEPPEIIVFEDAFRPGW
jgi:putative endonuclease